MEKKAQEGERSDAQAGKTYLSELLAFLVVLDCDLAREKVVVGE